MGTEQPDQTGAERHDGKRDPAEQETLTRDLGSELTDIFLHYVRGDISFADVTFETYETLQDLFIIASGEYELEYIDDLEYDVEEATVEQEELAQEPSREDG